MYSVTEYVQDLLDAGYSKEEAWVKAREEATKRKKVSVKNRIENAIQREKKVGRAPYHYAYATISRPYDD